jgi:hypothetical protein
MYIEFLKPVKTQDRDYKKGDKGSFPYAMCIDWITGKYAKQAQKPKEVKK